MLDWRRRPRKMRQAANARGIVISRLLWPRPSSRQAQNRLNVPQLHAILSVGGCVSVQASWTKGVATQRRVKTWKLTQDRHCDKSVWTCCMTNRSTWGASDRCIKDITICFCIGFARDRHP